MDPTNPINYSSVTPTSTPLGTSLRIPSLLRGVLPRPVRRVLRRVKIRILMHDFRKSSRR
jgi:hypothetical protein